ncbi:MAG: prolipoprotein diacylglyceryl transferase [Candidatus Pacearchaeota archaeon]
MINYHPTPTLNLGPITLHTWGIAVAISFLLAMILIHKKAKKEGLEKNFSESKTIDLLLIAIISGFIGARLLYAIEYGFQDFFIIWRGGLSWYGGLLLGTIAIVSYIKIKNIPFRYLELIALFLPISFAIARIGCFLNWDNYGLPTNLPWGVKVGNDLPRHPNQIYESLSSILIFFILFYIDKKQQDKKIKKVRKDKLILVPLFLFSYSLIRFLLDFLRDSPRYFDLTLAQWISLAIMIALFINFIIKKFIK